MKWGRKKPCSSPSNSTFFSPFSWISGFKKMSGNSASKATNERGKLGKNLSSTRLSWKEGRFYGRDEAYWQLSFEGEKKIQGGLKSVWYDSDEDLNFPLSNPKYPSRRKVREFPQIVEILQGNCSCEGEIEEECKFEPLNLEENRKLKEENMNNEKQRRSVYLSRGLPRNRAKQSSKTKEEKLKNEKQRKSFYLNRGSARNRAKQSSKTKACSVKMAAKIECKINALENKKKSKSKSKMANERMVRSKLAFDSFAVVKSSLDPEQDFVDSMVEMITEKRIQRPEELEELLACYLTLNHDEHHDLIIRVFKQVWCDLNSISFDREVHF